MGTGIVTARPCEGSYSCMQEQRTATYKIEIERYGGSRYGYSLSLYSGQSINDTGCQCGQARTPGTSFPGASGRTGLASPNCFAAVTRSKPINNLTCDR